MRSLAFHRNHFTAGPVLLDYDGADIAESYHLAFVGGTEENVKGGVLFRREADTLPHASQISLGDCKTFPLAFLLLQVTTEVEGIRLTRPISVEIHTESVLPRALPTVAERKRQALELLARWGEQNTNRALAILATGGDTARQKSCWPCSPTTSAAVSTAAIFTLSTTPTSCAPSANAAAVFCPKRPRTS